MTAPRIPRRTPLRMAVLFGGATTEHVISVRSARAVIASAHPDRITTVPVAIGRDGVWRSVDASRALLAAIDAGAPECVPAHETANDSGLLAAPEALAALRGVDLVFPLIHGQTGEDGSLQGLLELTGLPYIGAGVGASALGMDKALMKAVFRQAGLPIPEYRAFTEDDWAQDATAIERALGALPLPLFAKPTNGGSSLGVVKIHSREQIGPAVDEALRYDRKIVVEQGIIGREIECALLEHGPAEADSAAPRGAEATAPGEIHTSRDFYDYTAKYEDPDTQLILQPDLPAGVAQRSRELAVAAFQAIDCAGYARVDFFLDAHDALWINEINTIPGFTSGSMFARLWDAAGLPFDALIDRLAALALARAERRRRA